MTRGKAVPGHSVDASPAIVMPGVGERIDAHLRAAADLGFSGIVMVARDGEVILNRGYGWADRERGVPFRADMSFALSSIDKQFTAAAILRLQDRSLLDVHDPVALYIPRWPADRAGITLHHLLTHTSGLPIDVGDDEMQIGRDDMLERAFRVPTVAEPGSRWVYSNLGYSILAAVVEHVTGERFEQYLQREIFAPAGMTRTRFASHVDSVEYCGYRAFLQNCHRGTPAYHEGRPTWILMGGAGHLSTTLDLLRWHRALAHERAISAAAQSQATTGYHPTTIGGAAGYGWFVLDRPGHKLVYHTGGNGITSTRYERFLDSGVVIVQFTNNAAGVHRHVANDVTRIVFGSAYEELPKAARVAETGELRRYCGLYRTAAGEAIRVDERNGQLHVPLTSLEMDVTGFLSGQPSEATLDQRQSAISTTSRILSDVARGDLTTLMENLPPDADVQEERWFWSEFWPKMTAGQGSVEVVSYLGSERQPASNGSRPAGPLEVRLLAGMESGTQFIRARDLGNSRWYITPSYQAQLPPGRFSFIPVGDRTFLTRTFATRTNATMEFRSDGARAVEVILNNGVEQKRATRVDDCR